MTLFLFPFYLLPWFSTPLSTTFGLCVCDFLGTLALLLELQCCTVTWPEQSSCSHPHKIRRLTYRMHILPWRHYPLGAVSLHCTAGVGFALHTSHSGECSMVYSLTVKTAQQIQATIVIFLPLLCILKCIQSLWLSTTKPESHQTHGLLQTALSNTTGRSQMGVKRSNCVTQSEDSLTSAIQRSILLSSCMYFSVSSYGDIAPKFARFLQSLLCRQC